MNFEQLATQGRSKVAKSMAAAVSGKQLIAMRKKNLQSCFDDFYGKLHRLEYVASVHNIRYIDDAKSENINATWYSLESMSDNVIWITMSNDDTFDYAKITDLIMHKVKCIICVGNGESVKRAVGGYVRSFVEVDNIEDAVMYSFNISKSGYTVLFSPACKTKNATYEELGKEFHKAVNMI